MTTLITGVAGFIGLHVAQSLLSRGERLLGVDNVNDYYDVRLKEARITRLLNCPGFSFVRADVSDPEAIEKAVASFGPVARIIHLAAQAGVRHSLTDPYAYVRSNVLGQLVLLELARRLDTVRHFVYASSSSVYGGNRRLPFATNDQVDLPLSVYAATKRSSELLAYVYARTHGIAATGLRFFSVYGPWGRPDMAAYIFTDAIFRGQPLRLFNNGQMRRSFTYIDDIVAGALTALERAPSPDEHGVRHKVYNLGNPRSELVAEMVRVLEEIIGLPAMRVAEPMQVGDVPASTAEIDESRRDLGFSPQTDLRTGLTKFVAWYKEYHTVGS